VALALPLAACSSTSATSAESTESAATTELTTVRFALDWTPNTNHSGLYTAIAEGYFEDAGIEVEIPQNRALLEAVEGLADASDAPGDLVAGPATVAYTSWLLAVAGRGEVALTYAAILPCAWGYGDIGRRLVDIVQPHAVYAGWISFFASDAYDDVVVDLRAATDRALAATSPQVRREAADVFVTGCRFEREFWDAGLARRTWADLAAS
jgi:thiaminase/transcriptional activator TenA